MALENRRNINLHEVKAGLRSLVKQTAQVSAAFLVMLLLTGGNPSAFVVSFSVCLGILFVAWSEKNRLTISRKDSKSQNPISRSNLVSNVILSIGYLSSNELRDVKLSLHIVRRADLMNIIMSLAKLILADFSGVNLSGADFSGVNLSGANLSGVNLSDANLSNANLSHANLSNANLIGADLSHANLSYAYLSDADLSDANLSGANLSLAGLKKTTIVVNALFGGSIGLTEDMRHDLEQRGAIFGDRPPVLNPK